ncbi:hypothetical protein [Enemella evansiae]|uniref:hypothetical protein n=1 Tax=Enemella evansiae TaxID=2016499 RepID=UPI00117E61C6|nr:hypothetical protein [Enemella evansiae]
MTVLMLVGCALVTVAAWMVLDVLAEPASLGKQMLPILPPLITALGCWVFRHRPPTPVGPQQAQHVRAALMVRSMTPGALIELSSLIAFLVGYILEIQSMPVIIAAVLAGVLVVAVAWPRMSRLEEWEREMRRQVRR